MSSNIEIYKKHIIKIINKGKGAGGSKTNKNG